MRRLDRIAETAKIRGPRPLAAVLVRQVLTEAKVRLIKQIEFRRNRNHEAASAYTAMSPADFEAVNGLQAWANWRTIPRSLDGRLPERPLRAVDLCCGTGASTEVLAYYAPPGSSFLGLEFNPAFVERAKARRYLCRDGSAASVEFSAQSVLETFRDGRGAPLPASSVDLVNASGAVAFHFDADSSRALAAEIDRVLRPGGLATIDGGKQGTSTRELERIFAAYSFCVEGKARSCLLDQGTQLCLRKPGDFS
jgi:SAM-dependent methyltransferase